MKLNHYSIHSVGQTLLGSLKLASQDIGLDTLTCLVRLLFSAVEQEELCSADEYRYFSITVLSSDIEDTLI